MKIYFCYVQEMKLKKFYDIEDYLKKKYFSGFQIMKYLNLTNLMGVKLTFLPTVHSTAVAHVHLRNEWIQSLWQACNFEFVCLSFGRLIKQK